MIDYCYLGNWTSFKMLYNSLMYDFKLLWNVKLKWCNFFFAAWVKVLYFVNFGLGGYLLQNSIAGLIIEAEEWINYCYLGNWTSFKIMYISLMYDFRLLRNLKFKWWKLSFVGEYIFPTPFQNDIRCTLFDSVR